PASANITTHNPRRLTHLFADHRLTTHRDLPSFPTRRSSDLRPAVVLAGRRPRRAPPDGARPRPARAAAGAGRPLRPAGDAARAADRKSTRLNSSHVSTSYAVFCLKKKK